MTEDGQFAASIAAGERQVAVWQTTGEPRKKTRSAAGEGCLCLQPQWVIAPLACTVKNVVTS